MRSEHPTNCESGPAQRRLFPCAEMLTWQAATADSGPYVRLSLCKDKADPNSKLPAEARPTHRNAPPHWPAMPQVKDNSPLVQQAVGLFEPAASTGSAATITPRQEHGLTRYPSSALSRCWADLSVIDPAASWGPSPNLSLWAVVAGKSRSESAGKPAGSRASRLSAGSRTASQYRDGAVPHRTSRRRSAQSLGTDSRAKSRWATWKHGLVFAPIKKRRTSPGLVRRLGALRTEQIATEPAPGIPHHCPRVVDAG
jgi:hypothetical protein